jgi:hypothetical protein
MNIRHGLQQSEEQDSPSQRGGLIALLADLLLRG